MQFLGGGGPERVIRSPGAGRRTGGGGRQGASFAVRGWGGGVPEIVTRSPGAALLREEAEICRDLRREIGSLTISMIFYCCLPLLEMRCL